jgi:hypothetical protein
MKSNLLQGNEKYIKAIGGILPTIISGVTCSNHCFGRHLPKHHLDVGEQSLSDKRVGGGFSGGDAHG